MVTVHGQPRPETIQMWAKAFKAVNGLLMPGDSVRTAIPTNCKNGNSTSCVAVRCLPMLEAAVLKGPTG